MSKPVSGRRVISERFIANVCARLAENQRVRRKLPEGGRLHIDRRLPFLCVYRQPADRPDTGTRQLVSGEASFLIAPAGIPFRKDLSRLVTRIAETLAEYFGAFLVLEVWSKPAGKSPTSTDLDEAESARLMPGFQISARTANVPRHTVDALEKALRRITIRRQRAAVEVDTRRASRPAGMALLIAPADSKRIGCRVIGLEVRAIYRDPETGELLPPTLRTLRRGLSRALKQAFFTFSRVHTNIRPQHYYALGRRAMVKAVWEVDRRMADVSDSFDFLLQCTPINTESAWGQFKRAGFEKAPTFYYRPLAVEPELLKRRLHTIPIERIEDPTLAHLFRQRQDELDRRITMLADVGTPRFLLGSLQIYPDVEPSLLIQANRLLEAIPSRQRGKAVGRQWDARAFAERARAEIEYYRQEYPEFSATVAIRNDIYSGMLVSGGELLVGRHTRIPADRVDALVQHEIGTHLVTYYNGRAQPFRQLYTGLAGYDVLQEGLAVLAEYLVGGLSGPRLRLLAARVLAARYLIDGASFVETFRLLHRSCEFSQRVAFTLATRAYRGGGLTKDPIYLQGLVEILAYLEHGGDLEPLLVGKIAADHVPLMRELQLRQILRSPPLRPRYLDKPDVRDRLARLRQGAAVEKLIQDQTR